MTHFFRPQTSRFQRLAATFVFTFCGLLAPSMAESAVDAESETGKMTASVVRPTTTRLASLIKEATERSRTFRSLLGSLEATDGLVFIEEGKCPRAVPACLRLQMTEAGHHRILFVVISTSRPDDRLMASIGHELQHALEILADPLVRTTTALRLFYLRGKSEFARDAVETAAAQFAGDAVLREIQQKR